MIIQHPHHIIHPIQHIMSQNTYNSQPQPLQKRISLIIIFCFTIMRFSINFNNYMAVCAVEIHNIAAYDFLAVEIVTFELFLMQLLPQKHFIQIFCFAQFFCSLPQLWIKRKSIVVFAITQYDHPVASRHPSTGGEFTTLL